MDKRFLRKFPNKKSQGNRNRLSVASPPWIQPWKFPVLPRQFRVTLRSTYTDQRTGGQTTQAARIQPLFEYNASFPAMAPELFQIYRLSRIKAIGVSMEVINTSLTPLTATVTCLPLSIAEAVTDPRNISSIPGSITRQVGIATGMSRSKIVKTYIGEKELGESAMSGLEFTQTFAQAQASATQIKLPAIYAGVISTVSATSWTGVINYVYTWHLEFTEYTTGLTQLLELPDNPHDPSFEHEDESLSEEIPKSRNTSKKAKIKK